MTKLIDDVKKRLDEVYGKKSELESPKEPELKVFTMRLSLDLLEQLDTIASVMQLSRTEVARMILTHGIEDITEEFKIESGENHGATFEEMYDFENASPEEKKAMLEKWQQESKANKEVENND